jgi:hypothetical protein
MTRTMRSLGPLAVALLVFGIVVWQALIRDMAIGTWLLAAFLLGHGWVHLMFVMPRPAPAPAAAASGPVDFPFDLGHSWSTARMGLATSPVRKVGLVLMTVTVAGFMLAALATVGLLIPSEWWPSLVLVASIASVLLLGLFFQPGLLLGLAVDAVLLWLVIAAAWRPGIG